MLSLLYKDIEDVVKEAENIVFPDLCTLTNLMVTDKGFIRFIDYDGMQVGGRKSACISTMLGEQTQYFNDKYLDGDVYTKELDKKSLIMQTTKINIIYEFNSANINDIK